MAQVTLYCRDTESLKLGPGRGNVPIAGELIVFERGFATFEAADYPDWPAWAYHSGTPHLELLEGSDERAPGGDELTCTVCGKGPYASPKSLRGHLLSHAPRKAKDEA